METGFAGLHPPPSSLRKTHISDMTPNRAFLRGFPATRSGVLVSVGVRALLGRISALCLCIQKSRSQQPGCRANSQPYSRPRSNFCAAIRDLRPVLRLFRIESERLKLSAPFNRRIAESFDADAAGQATFYCCFDKIRCEEGQRDGHIDLPNAALLARAKFCDRGHSA